MDAARSDDLELRLELSTEYRGDFCQGWDFTAYDGLFTYDGRLTLTMTERYMEMYDARSDRLIMKGYAFTPVETIRFAPYVSDVVVARNAIVSNIVHARQKVLSLPITGQDMLPYAHDLTQ